MTHRPLLPASLLAAGALALTACTGAGASTPASAGAAPASLTVAAAFYPLEYVAQAVGGDHVSVTSLTPGGVEPHDVELSPVTVRALGDTDLVLYISDFQPAVEDAIDATGVASFDAADAVDFQLAAESGSGSADPHFWLDPSLFADYAIAVGDEFATSDPGHAGDYTANASALASQLRALDEEFTHGLSTCERTDFITSHEAFGYLARAYGLDQVGIAGLDPESEPSPARLREIHDVIVATEATTVFTETLVSPRVAEAVAKDSGVRTAVLDPIESVASGDDYRGVMLRNLDALTAALACE